MTGKKTSFEIYRAADAPPSEPPAKPAATRKPAAAPTKRARKT